MSDVLSRILANALGSGPGMGEARDGAPLGVPRLPTGEAGRAGGGHAALPAGDGGGLGGLLGGLADAFGGGRAGGGLAGGLGGGGLGAILGGLLGGGASGSGTGATIGGVRQIALMALLAYLTRGRGGAQGLSSLTEQLRGAGLGSQVDSWISDRPNMDVRPEELARAIPPDALDDIETHTGLARDEVLSELSRGLPGMVNQLTPRGRLPERDDELDAQDEDEVLRHFGIGPMRRT